ncbi:MAG: hypothetical protein KBD76_06050 [Bacteriovorax sp.]|nr:hypothetical protein [Bacteriovorax sp.]
MTNYFKISFVLFVAACLQGCSVKSTNSKDSSSSSTSPATTGTTSTTTTTTTTTAVDAESCGVIRDGATRCFYKNIPTIQVMGATQTAIDSGAPYWSSTSLTSTGTGVSPQQFVTDGSFNIRIIPRKANSSIAPLNPAVAGQPCSTLMNNSTKLRVTLRLRQKNATGGEIATLTSSLDTPSKVWRFSPPVTTDPLILEVMTVEADIRCNLSGKKLYCDYADIPLVKESVTVKKPPTECVAFDLQYSTDETYDLPGSTAN